MNSFKTLTLERLKSVLRYDPYTGVWVWLVYRKRSCKNIGDRADVPHSKGYRQLGIDGKTYMAHILAWFYVTGEWPKELIDHENTIKDDNRWDNLREATKSQNMYNKKSTSQSGAKGVYKVKNGRYRVLIQLGTFDTLEEASKIYNDAALKLQGEFAHSSIKEFF